MMVLLTEMAGFGDNMPDKPTYVNMTFESDVFGMLRYFDALSDEFIDNLFRFYIPDDTTFSEPRIQKMLIDELMNGRTFKFWRGVDEIDEFESNGKTLRYKIVGDSIITLILITAKNKYERNKYPINWESS